METATAIDLQKFCAPEGARFRADAPFVLGGWRYATDCKIVVRVPAEGEPDTPTDDSRGRFPPAAEAFAKNYPGKGEPMPWANEPTLLIRNEDCPQCHGRGHVGCEECKEEECLYCNGRKKLDVTIGRWVGKHLIGKKYDDLILTLPNVRFWVVDDPDAALPFAFDGGEGLVKGRSDRYS